MSQIHYACISKKHGPIQVQTGWDPRTTRYHLTVWRFGDDEPIVDDLLMHRMEKHAEIISAMRENDIPVPETVDFLLWTHNMLRVQNVIVRLPPQVGTSA